MELLWLLYLLLLWLQCAGLSNWRGLEAALGLLLQQLQLSQNQSLLLLCLYLQLVDLLLQSPLTLDQVVVDAGRLCQRVQGFLMVKKWCSSLLTN